MAGERFVGLSWSLGQWMPVLRRLPGAQRGTVAITLDDGPSPEATEGLIERFARFDAQGTFFLSGIRAAARPDLVEALVKAGHAVYAHGFEHIRLDRAGPVRMIEDMRKCEAILTRFRPTPAPYLVRLPYAGGYRNGGVHKALKAWQPGCQMAHWAVSLEDHTIAPRCATREDVEQECGRAVAAALARPDLEGSIILCHDMPFDVAGDLRAEVTLCLAETLLDGLARRGLASVALSPAPGQSLLSRFLLA